MNDEKYEFPVVVSGVTNLGYFTNFGSKVGITDPFFLPLQLLTYTLSSVPFVRGMINV